MVIAIQANSDPSQKLWQSQPLKRLEEQSAETALISDWKWRLPFNMDRNQVARLGKQKKYSSTSKT